MWVLRIEWHMMKRVMVSVLCLNNSFSSTSSRVYPYIYIVHCTEFSISTCFLFFCISKYTEYGQRKKRLADCLTDWWPSCSLIYCRYIVFSMHLWTYNTNLHMFNVYTEMKTTSTRSHRILIQVHHKHSSFSFSFFTQPSAHDPLHGGVREEPKNTEYRIKTDREKTKTTVQL